MKVKFLGEALLLMEKSLMATPSTPSITSASASQKFDVYLLRVMFSIPFASGSVLATILMDFSVFEKEGIFNKETAKRFRKVLESGDTVDPSELYREFKGSDPTVEALMRRDGIIK